MQTDEVIWQVINQGFCSYKAKLPQVPQTFCRNRYNVTGLCNRSSCPLANSRYATVIEKEGVCWLYMKTIERAHTPKDLWERVKLSKNYMEALKQIDEHLLYWPNFLRHKTKQRLTKIRQYLIRMRKLKTKELPKLVGVHAKHERRERTREDKALRAARLDQTIKAEILERLKKGIYEGVNVDERRFQQVLEEEGQADEDTDDELEEEEEEAMSSTSEVEEEDEAEDGAQPEEEEEEEDAEGGRPRSELVHEYVEDLSDLEDFDELDDLGVPLEGDDEAADTASTLHASNSTSSSAGTKRKSSAPASQRRKQKKARGARVEIEYEQEAQLAPAEPAETQTW